MKEPWPSSVPVLIPVYNHARTVGEVIAGCRALGAHFILVVDDGSTDGSGEAARQAGADRVLTLSPNQGKGAALRVGLRELAAVGHAAALTIDADMQHPPAEGLRLAQAADTVPGLWLGIRDMALAPRASRLGRWWTSLWTWVVCGWWPQDNQTGLRVYPLPVMSDLPIRAGRYAFEIESLVKAVWHRVPVHRLDVAVRYPADRISHFRVWLDSVRTAWAFARLVARRCMPWPYEGFAGWRAAFTTGLSPGSLASASALGAAMGVAPVPGLQMLVAVWLAMKLRLNPGVALLASNISFGPLLAAWFALEIVIGHALRTGGMIDLQALRHGIADEVSWTTMAPWLGYWLIGSIPVMAACALVMGGVTWIGAILWQRARA